MNINVKETGEKIRKFRNESGLKIKDVANALAVSEMSVYKWQSGHCLPTIDNLFQLARIFGVKVDDIVVVEGDEIKISPTLTLIDKIRADIESAKEEVWELYGHELGLDRILTYDRCLEILDKYDERREKG